MPSCPKSGCLAVWGVWYRISNKQSNNTFLDQILPYVNATGAVGALCLPSFSFQLVQEACVHPV